MTQSVIKDPDAVLDYGEDWHAGGNNDGASTDAGWLQADTISTSTWAVSGPDSALVIDSDTNDTTSTTVWLSGGTLGREYTVTNHIVTAAGRADDRAITVTIAPK